MNEFTSETPGTQTVARKTLQGAYALGIRQVFVQGTKILGAIFLARLLTPSEFGFYAIILYLQTFLTAFGDAGLAASLVRQVEEPDTAAYQAVFTIQQAMVLLLTSLFWIAAPTLAAGYHLQAHDAWLFRLVALSFLITSFMVIPQVRLERHLAFQQLAVIETVQAITFNGLAVYFAWRGMGAYAFVWALLVRSFLGAVLANRVSPWKIGWHWNWPIIRSHLSFGLSYQGTQVASLLKDSITPIFIGIFLGTADVGYITWASMIAAYPVLVLFILQRLYMPAFARLQYDKRQLAQLVQNVIWATNVITAPLALLTLAMIVPITTTIYGPKWLVALPYFYFFWLANLFVPTATPAMGLLNAVGKSKLAFLFSLIWMAGTWLVGAPLIWMYGAIGFAAANCVVQFSNIWLFRAAQRTAPFRLLRLILPVWAIGGVSAALVFLACRLHLPLGIWALCLYGTCGLLVYGSGIYLFYKGKIHATWYSLRGAQ